MTAHDTYGVPPVEQELIAEAWSALVTADGQEIEPPLLTGVAQSLPSRFAVSETATACVATALMAAEALQRQRTGVRVRLALDRNHVEVAVRSERYFRAGSQSTGAGFAPLSRFWRARDGWVRTHANYPWHRHALLTVLDAPDEHDAVAAAIADRSAAEIESTVFAAGGIAAAVRSIDEWRRHPQGAAVHAESLIAHRSEPNAPPRRRRHASDPLSGVRVLDLTRVIAGPVCTRYLGSFGADVLRLDPPQHPDLAAGRVADTLLGKRSAMLDAATADGHAKLLELLPRADVVVCGYRPGALDRFGMSEASLVERYPGLVVVFLDAWGHTGPWASRRGFDSVVQAPTGIALGESTDGAEPGALPCQLLDHGTGYLAAAAALDGVRRQEVEGGTHISRLSLARTAAWITSRPVGAPPGALPAHDDPEPWLQHLDSFDSPITAVRPPGQIGDHPLVWSPPPTRYGADPPEWSSRRA